MARAFVKSYSRIVRRPRVNWLRNEPAAGPRLPQVASSSSLAYYQGAVCHCSSTHVILSEQPECVRPRCLTLGLDATVGRRATSHALRPSSPGCDPRRRVRRRHTSTWPRSSATAARRPLLQRALEHVIRLVRQRCPTSAIAKIPYTIASDEVLLGASHRSSCVSAADDRAENQQRARSFSEQPASHRASSRQLTVGSCHHLGGRQRGWPTCSSLARRKPYSVKHR